MVEGTYLFAHPAASIQDEACSTRLQTGIGRTADDLVNWVAMHPGIQSTSPASTTIDGHPARWVDIEVAASWTKSCGSDPRPAVSLITDANGGSAPYGLGPQGPERMRMIFVDLGGGHVLLIVVDSSDPARFQDLADQSMPIIQSFTFR